MIKLKRILGNIKNILGNCLTLVKNKAKQFFPWLKAKLNKTKKWFMRKKKHEKFIIGGISLATLLVIVICGFTIDFSRLLGNVYNIEDIGSNIDDIKVGDTINYTGNGYNNWEVLNINKEDNTIDIISKIPSEYVTIPCEMGTCNNYYTILQNTADKYLDGKYAISARCIGQEDFNKFKKTHSSYTDFFVNIKTDTSLTYASHSESFYGASSDDNGYYVPVVQLSMSDTTGININDVYNYTLNNISEWFVVNVYSDSILIVPKYASVVDFYNSGAVNPDVYFKAEKAKYYDENVISVNELSSTYIDELNAVNYGQLNSKYSYFYTGTSDVNIDNYVNGNNTSRVSSRYSLNIYQYDKNSNIIKSSSSTNVVYSDSLSSGFMPVVTIKYNNEKEAAKKNDVDHNLRVGDYVKYSANGYNNWKVLNIDEKNNTVDIISGGIVKNITLEGKEDYDNLGTLLQEEVDKYKSGKDVVSARVVNVDDFGNLKAMNDQLSAQYFLNNKLIYRPLYSSGQYSKNYINYTVGIGYYDSTISEISKDWALIAHDKSESNGSDVTQIPYKYTAGVRPIITLKLPEVEKIENIENVPSIEESTTVLVKEQIRVNKAAQPVIKDSQIKEENIVKEVGCDSAKCSEIEIKQDNYIDFIILIIVNIILTIAIVSLDKIKEYLRKHKKSKKTIVTVASVLVLTVASVFGLTLNSSNLAGNIYGINSIGYNIDNIKVGDTINYKANGYSDWQVLNINKEDNTIDIVSKTSTENVSFKYADLENYSDILQETANKYLNDKRAISARAVNEDDLKNFEATDSFWIDKQADGYYHTNLGAYRVSDSYISGSILPVVTLAVTDTTNFNVGDNYTYSLNGVEEWIILYIEDSTSISIIPKVPINFKMAVGEYNVGQYINNEIDKYRNDSILSVRSILASDRSTLNSVGYGSNMSTSICLYTGKLLLSETVSDSFTGVNYSYTRYKYEYLYRSSWSGSSFSESYGYSYDYSYESGFRPVVTIKYSDKEKEGKDIKTDLKVGDYVKYSANGYNNWKVLNIDKENNTVDIISGGLVKNVTLEGKENYDNLETIFQEEVDEYKTGKYAIKARMVSSSDFDDLRAMKDELSVRYFLNNKNYYTDKGESVLWVTPTYTVGVTYYDSTISDINNEWAVLAQEIEKWSSEEQKNYKVFNPYKYTAGLRPIITLDLNKVKEVKEDKVEDVTSKNETLVKEQKKYNKYSQAPIKNDEIETNTDTIEDEVVDNEEPLVIVSDLECECEEKDPTDSWKYKLVIGLFIIDFVIAIVILLMKLFGFKIKGRKVKE